MHSEFEYFGQSHFQITIRYQNTIGLVFVNKTFIKVQQQGILHKENEV